MIKSKLKDLELLWDPDHKEYFLRAKYEVENDYCVEEHIFPHIVLPVSDDFAVEGSDCIFCGYGAMRLRTGEVEAPENAWGVVQSPHVKRIIKEKPQEMTIEEIEKKLGYKIKIVGSDKE